MKITFFGTPDYVVPIAEFIHREHKSKGKSPIVAVVTQKPKPKDRKQILSYSAVDSWAYKRKIPIFFHANDILKNKIDTNLGILASYGEIIPDSVIRYFKYGILNIHPSLLPKFRGASPVPASIILGGTETGVSIIKLDSQLDHGDIICQFKEDILPSDTTDSLRKRLFLRSAEVTSVLLESYIQGKIKPRKQDEKDATFTRQLNKEDAFIPPEMLRDATKGKNIKKKEMEIAFIGNCKIKTSIESLNNFVRAMSPWPCAWTKIKLAPKGEAKRVKIISSHIEGGKFIPDEVQLEGKNKVSWNQFCQGYPEFSF